MPKENPIDFHWKNKLEDINSLSGELLANKSKAWEKLYIRLRQKPHRIRPVWYWLAAACLIFIIIFPLVNNKRQNILSKNYSKSIQHKNSTAPAIQSSKEDLTTGIISLPIKKVKTVSKILPISNKRLYVNNVSEKEAGTSANLNNQKNTQEQPIVLSPTVIDSVTLPAIAAVTVKKKLRVVHINELGDPVTETYNIARHYEQHSFQLNPVNQEVFTGSALSSPSIGFTIFKTIKAPSN